MFCYLTLYLFPVQHASLGLLETPLTPPFFPVSLVWFPHLTLSFPAIGQSASLLYQLRHDLHSAQKDYPTASTHLKRQFSGYVNPLCVSAEVGAVVCAWLVFFRTDVDGFVILSAEITGGKLHYSNVWLWSFLFAEPWSSPFLIGRCWSHTTHGIGHQSVLVFF